MTSTSDATQRSEQGVVPGTQLLAALSSMESALSVPPAGAFDNLLLVSPNSPRQVEAELRDRGVDVSNVGLIPISGSEHGYEGPLWTTDTISPSDLTGLSMAFTRSLQHLTRGHGWVLFENLNVLLLYADEQQVYRLVDHLIQKTRARDVSAAYAVVEGAIGERTFARLRNRFDTVRGV
ncbi:DUF7504 family protein [Halorientalis pallida]|uniref:Uncharacterized protein n=1 Tax=Halorientalis pallida TaxID=2479928 RepID=A0A498KV33_9EURY|nr:hypothetical protein [Halorientalis pallida]RXK49037.1 hypothetical protein EAF64_08885 [Halorientalis pallida]